MKRKVQFVLKKTIEMIVEVPDDKARSPEEQMWLLHNIKQNDRKGQRIVEMQTATSFIVCDTDDSVDSERRAKKEPLPPLTEQQKIDEKEAHRQGF